METDRFGAWLNLVQADAVVAESLEQQLQRECELSLPEQEVLARLGEAEEGRLRMADLASQMLVSKSGVTRLIDRLEKQTLVSRGECLTDRRVTYAVITDAGYERLRKSRPVLARAIETTFSSFLNDSDIRALRRVLRKVLEGNGKWDDSRCSLRLGQETSKPRARA